VSFVDQKPSKTPNNFIFQLEPFLFGMNTGLI
jgi:hypothetical protein